MHTRQQDYAMTQSLWGGQGGEFPGIGNPYVGGGTPSWPAAYNPEFPVPGGTGGFGGAGGLTGGASGGAAGGSGAGGLLGGLNLNQVKGFIDKMGGIDGLVSTMTRVQKMVSSFQQMAPMLKLLMGSFGGKAASKSLDFDDLDRPRRKRARKKGKNTGRKVRRKGSGSGSGSTWTPKRKKVR